MRRRQFIAAIGGAVAWPLAVRSQQAMPKKVGFLCLGNPDPEPFLKTLKSSLRDLGHTEGKDIQFLVRSAEGNAAILPSLATELVLAKASVIVAFQTPTASAAKAATQDIPIVMWVADSVQQGFAQSLARPGGNLTGVDPAAETAQKKSGVNPGAFSCCSTGCCFGQCERSIPRNISRSDPSWRW